MKKQGIINQYFRVQGKTQMEVSGNIGGLEKGLIASLLRDKWWLLHIASFIVYISSFIKSLTMFSNIIGISLNLLLLVYTFQLGRPSKEEHVHS